MRVSYFGLYRLQIPIIFHAVSVGSHYPFKRHRVPHFLPNLTHFSPFTPIFTHIFPVFVLCNPTLAVFMLRASLLTPQFLLYLPLTDCQRKIRCCCLILACLLFISLKSTNCACSFLFVHRCHLTRSKLRKPSRISFLRFFHFEFSILHYT